jgi:hypothetical protein
VIKKVPGRNFLMALGAGTLGGAFLNELRLRAMNEIA